MPKVVERFKQTLAEKDREERAKERSRRDSKVDLVRKETYPALRQSGSELSASIEGVEERCLHGKRKGKAVLEMVEGPLIATDSQSTGFPSSPPQSSSTDEVAEDCSPGRSYQNPDEAAIWSLQEDLEQQQTRVEGLEQQLQERTQQRDQAITDCNEAKKRNIRALGNAEETARRREEAKEFRTALEDLQGEVGNLQLEIARAKDREHRLRMELQDLTREVDRLKAQRDSREVEAHSSSNAGEEKRLRKGSKVGKDEIEISRRGNRTVLSRPKSRKSFLV